MTLVARLIREERAQGMLEYGLIGTLILVIVLIATKLVGTATNAHMENIASQIS
jgi:Flp pilus assembly pilin Flp